jgi:hypothetical protein
MSQTSKTQAIVNQHFKFETPELVERVVETFAEDIIWEAPARNLYLTDHEQIAAQYRKIIAGVKDPCMKMLHHFASGNQAFDDRILSFTAVRGNVWGVEPDKKVEMRLAHYFKITDGKISHEIGYEMLRIL